MRPRRDVVLRPSRLRSLGSVPRRPGLEPPRPRPSRRREPPRARDAPGRDRADPAPRRRARGTTPPRMRAPCRRPPAMRLGRLRAHPAAAPRRRTGGAQRPAETEESGRSASSGQRASASSYCAAATAKLLSADARSPAARSAQARTLDDLVVVAPGGSDELECRAPVVREHLGVILRASEAVDPLRDALGASRARSARGIWPYDTSRTSACANANSLSPSSDERRWRRTKPLRSSEWSVVVAASGSASDRARPEHLSDDCRVLQQALLRVGKPVEAGGDDALERLRAAGARPSSPARR